VQTQFGYKLLELLVFFAKLRHFIAAGFSERIALQTLLACLQKRFAPLIVHTGSNAFSATDVGNAVFSLQAFQNDPDFFFRVESPAGLSLDLTDNRFRALLGFRFHCSLLSQNMLLPKTVSYFIP
jgi:hypothetical protein